MKFTRNLGMLCLGGWLILGGLQQFMNLSFNGLSTLMAALAIAAGVLIIMGK